MQKLLSLIAATSVALFSTAALAQEHGRDQEHDRGNQPQYRGEEHHEGRGQAPRFEAHQRGVHPNGSHYYAHQTRILQPNVVIRGRSHWQHWTHPAFARPYYYWNWGDIRQVTCVAEDSYGDQYPVTESAGRGFALDNMTAVEDDALDRCYNESGEDGTCYLATCSHF
jgi:hypothetical protein